MGYSVSYSVGYGRYNKDAYNEKIDGCTIFLPSTTLLDKVMEGSFSTLTPRIVSIVDSYDILRSHRIVLQPDYPATELELIQDTEIFEKIFGVFF